MADSYARALWEMVARGMPPKKAVRALYDSLALRSRTDLIPRIAKAFARLAARHRRKENVVLTVAREKDERKAIAAAKELLERIGAVRSDVEMRFDDALIGGWRLEGRECLVDASYKRYLLDMYSRATRY